MPSSLTDVTELVARAAREVPDRPAVTEADGGSLTWGELEDRVARVATGLGTLGVTGGHRVMIVLTNRLEFVTCYLGVLRAQVVAVPVNPRSSTDELVRMIADSGSRVVVAEEATLPAVREAVARVQAALDGDGPDADAPDLAPLLERAVRPRIVIVGDRAPGDGVGPEETAYADLVAGAAVDVPPLPDAEKLACLLYTSGTSGRPRAAMLSHRALLANLEQVGEVEPPMIHGDDVVLGVLPLFHVYGLNAVLGAVLRQRARLVLVGSYDPLSVLSLIEDQACTVVPVAPPVFTHWLPLEHLAEQLGPVRMILSGSAPLSAEVIEEFGRRVDVPVHQGYGLTEAAPVVTSTLCSVHLQAGSVGAALPGIEIRLRDETGAPPEGEDPGEIEIRGANLFSGYWPDGDGGPDEDGWWATGDVGFLDADGDLFLVDRVKELVIVSGFNVYPSEVEDVLREVPGVADAAVIGVADPETGEAVVAYVVPAGPSDDLASAVSEHAERRLARFKQPVRIEVVEALPLTVTGKVQKGRLRGLERRRHLDLLES